MQAMTAFIKKTRPNVTNLKWLGQQDLPDLAKPLKLAPWPNQHGVAIKLGYDLNGQPVEEAFYGVYYISKKGSDAVSYGHTQMAAGMLQQTNSVVESCRRLQVPVRDYFSTILPGLADLPIRCLPDLTPAVGRPAFIDSATGVVA
jgi:hypothetical protein